jgi:hypothetical protein
MNSGNQQKGTTHMTTTAIEAHGPRKSYSGKIVLDARCIRNYPQGQWLSRERERLTNAIDRVAGNEP